MKILCNTGHGANGFMKHAWEQVFKYCGHEFYYWNPDKDDAEKAFSIEPDLFIGTTYDLNKRQISEIRKRKMKVALIGSDWGPLTESMDLSKYQIVFANDKEIRLVEELKPDLIFIHYDQSVLNDTHLYWNTKLGIPITAITQCADLFDYYNGNIIEELKSDIAFIGGYWGYKAQNLNKYMIPICKKMGKYKINIFGNQPWPVTQYQGPIDTRLVPHVIKSALICPNIGEPHFHLGAELMERPFKVLSSGGFCISEPNKSMKKIFGDSIPYFDNEFEFLDMVDHFVKNPDDRIKYMKNGYELVTSNHTGFHRVNKLLTVLGFEKEAEGVLVGYEEFLGGNN